MEGWVIKNSDGLYWQNKDHHWKKTIIAASIYSSKKAAINNYDISYQSGNSCLKIYKDCKIENINIIGDKIYVIKEILKEDKQINSVIDIAFHESDANNLLTKYTKLNSHFYYICQELCLSGLKEQREMLGIK